MATESDLARLMREFAPGAGTRFHVRPLGLIDGPEAVAAIATGLALPLLGDSQGFTAIELSTRDAAAPAGIRSALASIDLGRRWAASRGEEESFAAQLAALGRARADWAGFSLDRRHRGRPLVMGIVNATPDSFSDGGLHCDPASAIAHGVALLEAGADLLDIGGESTRPGAGEVPAAEEIRRIEPVIAKLAERGAVLAIDTRHAATMRAALAAGARIINDVSALSHEPESLRVAAASGAPLVLMHMRGEPATMQRDPEYANAPLDVLDYLERRIAVCAAAGIPRERIAIDPGLGFGKTTRHNFQLLERLSLLHLTGCPILIGASRKSFTAGGAPNGIPPGPGRLAGSLAAAIEAARQGAQILRVHDVAETRQALEICRRIREAG